MRLPRWERWTILLLLFGVSLFLLPMGLSYTPAREDLKQVAGKVVFCEVKEERGGPGDYYKWLEAKLEGYDRELTFREPDDLIDEVAEGLSIGSDVVMLVHEWDEEKAEVWELKSEGKVFLNYETKAAHEEQGKLIPLGYSGACAVGALAFGVWWLRALRRPCSNRSDKRK